MQTRNSLGPISFLLITFAAGLLSGCSGSFAPSPVTPEQVPIGNLVGGVHGGNLPVSGASIYLYQASSSNYGTAATSLICNSTIDKNPCPTAGANGPFKDSSGNYYVTTNTSGSFALSGTYMCTQNAQVYAVAVGGNPGLATFTTTATFSTNKNTITVANASGVVVGYSATGTGVSGTVTAVSGTTVTISQNTTAAGSGVSVIFSPNNTAIVQMSGLGECPTAGNLAAQVPFVEIDEATTVGFAYAMGGFATTPYNVSSDAGGATGLANAMANFLNIVYIANGQTYGPGVAGNANSVSPQKRINTLANILATCVNQTSSSAGPCQSLFGYATTSSGTPATDEGSAIFNIVHNQALMNSKSAQTQAQNVTALYNLMNGNEPFGPYLTSAPTDWTMPVIYNNVISKPVTSGTTITSGPYNLVFDAGGDAWIGDRINGVIEIGPQGAVKTFSNATEKFSMVKGVAVSPQDGTIWVSDFGNNVLDIMSPTGTIQGTVKAHITGNGPVSTVFALNSIPGGDYMGYEVNETVAGIVAVDAGTDAATHYAGNANTPEDFQGDATPGWIYVDSTGTVWIPSTNTEYVGELQVYDKSAATKYAPNDLFMGAVYTTVPEQLGMAADAVGGVWAATNIVGYGTGLYDLVNGTPVGGGAVATGGGLNNPYKTFIDGNNEVWIANGGGNVVSGYQPAVGTTAGYWLSSVGFSTDAAAGTGAVVLGVDPSGDVWTGNSDNSVTQLLGLATPTAAPLYGGRTNETTGTVTTNGNLGTKP